MDFKEIKRLITMVEEAQISGFKIDTGTIKIEIEKHGNGQTYVTTASPTMMAHAAHAPAPVSHASDIAAPKVDKPGATVKSPMVGTFYASPSPDAAAFVSVGDTISKGQVVCIVEAMKLFNEIESDVSGVIEKILVNSGDPVEYGQDLFILRA